MYMAGVRCRKAYCCVHKTARGTFFSFPHSLRRQSCMCSFVELANRRDARPLALLALLPSVRLAPHAAHLVHTVHGDTAHAHRIGRLCFEAAGGPL